LEHTRPERRGFVLGVFASTFAGAMALGGVLISLFGHSGPTPFFAGAGIALIGLAGLLLPGPGLTSPEGEHARPSALLARILAAPIVFLAPVAMGAIETAKYNLVPIYARRAGLGDEVAAGMITASGLGVLLLQPAIGALGDRLGPRWTLALCAAAGIALPLLVAAVGAAATPALAMMFLYSGIVTGLYTVGLIWMARFFSGGALAAGNAAFALCYGVGQLIGPALAGAAFSAGGPTGFMGALAGLAGVYLLALALLGRRAGAAGTA
jgi:predicted MFS family arabinose efflux permease